jgi:hypothetical protein
VKGKLFSLLAGTILSLTALPLVTPDASVAAEPRTPRTGETAMNARVPPAAAAALGAAVRPAGGVAPDVLDLALMAVRCAVDSGDLAAPKTLTLIDYSKPSTEPRLWVFDMTTGDVLFKELVAHGRNTGDNMATQFSDTLNSRQSSIGLFRTDNTYVGRNGYSLRLDGLEPGFNGHARERAIVMHGAPYVSAEFARAQGRIGRSWGCPALDQKVSRQVIDTIKGGSLVFAYAAQSDFLSGAEMLAGSTAANTVLASIGAGAGAAATTTALASR